MNLITNNSSYGVDFSTGSSTKFENNRVTAQSYGIVYRVAGNDLGGGGSSIGNNSLWCNNSTDLWASAAATASYNNWDHASPTYGASTYGNGLDLYTNGFASSVTSADTGSGLVSSPCNAACDPSASAMQSYNSVMTGCAGSGVTWANRGNMCPGNCHVCLGAEYASNFGITAPGHTYWLGNKLGDNGSGQVAPVGTSGFTNNCGSPSGDTSMLVAPDGSSKVFVSGWGYQTATNQHFGGCSNPNLDTTVQDGALCCCP